MMLLKAVLTGVGPSSMMAWRADDGGRGVSLACAAASICSCACRLRLLQPGFRDCQLQRPPRRLSGMRRRLRWLLRLPLAAPAVRIPMRSGFRDCQYQCRFDAARCRVRLLCRGTRQSQSSAFRSAAGRCRLQLLRFLLLAAAAVVMQQHHQIQPALL